MIKKSNLNLLRSKWSEEMNKFRESLLNKVSKAEEFQKASKSDEVALSLSESELRLVKIGLRALDSYEKIISEECSK